MPNEPRMSLGWDGIWDAALSTLLTVRPAGPARTHFLFSLIPLFVLVPFCYCGGPLLFGAMCGAGRGRAGRAAPGRLCNTACFFSCIAHSLSHAPACDVLSRCSPDRRFPPLFSVLLVVSGIYCLFAVPKARPKTKLEISSALDRSLR